MLQIKKQKLWNTFDVRFNRRFIFRLDLIIGYKVKQKLLRNDEYYFFLFFFFFFKNKDIGFDFYPIDAVSLFISDNYLTMYCF